MRSSVGSGPGGERPRCVDMPADNAAERLVRDRFQLGHIDAAVEESRVSRSYILPRCRKIAIAFARPRRGFTIPAMKRGQGSTNSNSFAEHNQPADCVLLPNQAARQPRFPGESYSDVILRAGNELKASRERRRCALASASS
jgi:hypothetical protein